MSVLRCGRRGCEAIMCDRCSDEHGYICDECFEELIHSGVETLIDGFMDTTKSAPSNEEQARAKFSSIFTDRWQDG